MERRKIINILIIILIIILIFNILVIANLQWIRNLGEKEEEEDLFKNYYGNNYQQYINRIFNSTGEELAIYISENLDYPNITGIPRFTGHLYQNNVTYNLYDYHYTNYIDGYILDNIPRRLEYFKDNDIYVNSKLEYEASVTSILNGSIKIQYRNATIITDGWNEVMYLGGFKYVFHNNSWAYISGQNLTLNFSQGGYLIELYWFYNEHSAPTAGYSTTHHQWIILDINYAPLLIVLGDYHHTVS